MSGVRKLFILFAILCAHSFAFAQAKKIGVYSGTFNPPHMDHVGLVLQVKTKLGLDTIYVIPNVSSDHKNNVLSYEHRKEMTRLAFGNEPGIFMPNQELEDAFRQEDMLGVLKKIHSQYPEANIYQIMGDDSFVRYRKVPENVRFTKNVSLVVIEREAIEAIPHTLGATPIISMKVNHHDLSSTLIRKSLDQAKPHEAIAPAVWKYIQDKKLYGFVAIECSKLFATLRPSI